MATLPKTGTVTYEEWLRMPETEGREEVVNGEIRLMPTAKFVHAPVVANLVAEFHRQLDGRKVEVFSGSFGIVIRRGPLTCRIPDIAVFEEETWVVIEGYFHSAPELAIEVLSPSETRRLTGERLRDYESIGILEVWIISPEAQTVEVLLLDNGGFRREALLAEGLLKPTRFPSVQIDITQIWPD
jgi:Uma2 family endonuclease